MALDKFLVGERIRKIREEMFEETREKFAKRCDLTERHIGQLERGDFLPGIQTLDKISSFTGIDVDYILYGKEECNKLQMKQNLHNIIDRADKDEIQMLYRNICTIRSYVSKKTEKRI
ncbi:MAG: helix-turn-helix transcriptional regulator [Clostridia bacterium]|nr:helix-turn-helix transcriptional regulator [Clostridia bacterium]